MSHRRFLEPVDDSFKAFLVDGARFTLNEEYPIIEKEMVATQKPIEIISFSEAITFKGDLSKKFVHFYSPDKTFERIRKDPKRYLSFFKRTAGIIGFDFSIHTDMQNIKQKAQINDCLSYTFYYGKNNVSVIPNIRYGVDDTSDEFLSAIPKRTLVAIGTHGFIKMKHQKHEWRVLVKRIISILEPSGIVVVGTFDKTIIDEYKKRCTFYLYDSLIDQRNREGKYGNKRSE